ncbi:hypothetical protein BGX27_006718 [Mortierella sp. AM989]|nr:hypothetical protein BGX27_006718 [Mortierella sp. AM989]
MDRDFISQSKVSSPYESKKKTKKFKKVNLLRNPFSDSNGAMSRSPFATEARSGAHHKNPFSDSHSLLSKISNSYGDDRDDDDDEEDEEDEERMVRARRDALAALDPKNKASRTAEFKSLRVHLPSKSLEQDIPDNTEYRLQEAQSQRVPSSSPPQPLPLLRERTQMFGTTQEDQIMSTVQIPPQSFQLEYHEQSNNKYNVPSTPGFRKDASVVPEIAISLATPSPRKHHHRGSSIATTSSKNSSLLFLSSPLSPIEEPGLDEWGLPIGDIKPKVNRTTALYKNLFHRITSSSVANGLSGKDEEEIEDHIGAEIDRDPASFVPKTLTWSLKRSTFGTPMQQGNQQQRRQDSRSSRKKNGSRKYGSNSRPWDSGDDILLQDPDYMDDQVTPNYLGQADQSLKGRVGVRRSSDDEGDSLVGREQNSTSRSLLNRGGNEDWMVHPRTAAIRGTFHRVRDEVVPVPNKPIRPMSLNSYYTTTSFASLPAPRSDISSLNPKNGASLSRGGSLDSSVYRMKKGATSLIMSTGSVPLQVDGKNQEYQDESLRRTMNGTDVMTENNRRSEMEGPKPENDGWISNYRSSSATFGMNTSPESSLQATFPRFSSFHELISSATNLIRSSSVPGNVSPPPLSPTAYVRRSRTTAFGESQYGISRHKNIPVMVPTIVVPHNPPYERSALSATTVTFNSDSASSSVTMFSSSDGLDQHVDANGGFINRDLAMINPGSESQGNRHRLAYAHPNQQNEDLLKVPEPARTTSTRPNNLSTTATTAASRTLSRYTGSSSSDSLVGSLTSDDYIGQFELERAHARHEGAHGVGMSSVTSSSSSLATTVNMGGMSYEAFPRSAKMIDMMQIDTENDEKLAEEKENQHQQGQRSFWRSSRFSLLRCFRKRDREESGQSDISEKLMHLPEPSRFEGICSCRGFINITSMLLVMCGLVLLVLGYPIVNGLKKDRMAAEAENAAVVNGGNVTVIGGSEGRTITQVKYKMANSTLTNGVVVSRNGDKDENSNHHKSNSTGTVATTAAFVKFI